jgi:hypothetical protein
VVTDIASSALTLRNLDLGTVQRRAFTGPERAFLVGVPLAWAILLLFHPIGEGEDFYPIIRHQVTAWELVHIGTMVFIPLMAAVGFLLLRGVDGSLAAISRAAFAVFGVVYMAWEVVIGIGTGVLVDEVNQLTEAERSTGAGLVEQFTDSSLIRAIEYVGTGAWLVAVIAAGAALVRQTGASRLVLVLLVLSALPTAWHVPPFGQLGLAFFIGAVVLVLRGQSPTRDLESSLTLD